MIENVIKTGSVALLDDLLQLLASTRPGMKRHVAACCLALASSINLPRLSQDMVRLLVRAVTVTAGVPIHFFTFQVAIREASCLGNSSALAGLLEAHPPTACVDTALHYAAKTQHGHVVEQLVAAGAEVSRRVQLNALCWAHPQVVRPVVAAMQRAGAFGRDAAAEALRIVVGNGGSHYGNTVEKLAQVTATLRVLVGEFAADPAARNSGCLAVACVQREPFDRLADLLLLMGAEPDAALVSLCESEGGPLPHWHSNAEGVQGLLALGAESPEAASRALARALERGWQAPARRLLGSGAVPAAACEGLLLRALGAERAGALAGPGGGAAAAGAAGVEQGAVLEAGHDDAEGAQVGEAGEEGGVGAEGQQQQQRQRRWDWVWELARAGALRRRAVVAAKRALEDACRAGDAEAVGELASLGVIGPNSCAAAFWLAFDGGHQGCMERLEALGCVGEGVRREARRVLAARETLRRLQDAQAAG